MSRWARLDKLENKIIVGEIITYDPKSFINEKLWDLFVPCDDNVLVGFYYNSDTNQFYLPENYGRSNLNDFVFKLCPPECIVGENYVFVPDPNYVRITE